MLLRRQVLKVTLHVPLTVSEILKYQIIYLENVGHGQSVSLSECEYLVGKCDNISLANALISRW